MLGCMQAEDDPIAPKTAIPYAALEANPRCTLVVTPGGGHLGWGAGPEGPFGAPHGMLHARHLRYSCCAELHAAGFQQESRDYA